jgi:hypothetical protein
MARGKAHYRATVLDLIRAGILNPGDEATFEPRRGEVYRGQVEANGDLTLDGRQFDTPSDAATTLAGNSRNGWKEVKVNGRPLDEYRKQLGGPKPRAVQPPPPRAEPPARASLVELIRAADWRLVGRPVRAPRGRVPHSTRLFRCPARRRPGRPERRRHSSLSSTVCQVSRPGASEASTERSQHRPHRCGRLP